MFGSYGTAQNDSSALPPNRHLDTGISLQFVNSPTPPNYDKSVLLPLKAFQDQKTASCKAAQGTLDGITCILPPSPPQPPPAIAIPLSTPLEVGTDGLDGSVGYSMAGGNCVDEPGVNNPGWGNPIDWPITSGVPWVGASALFYFNHVAVVSGIWSNGDIEVRQQNSPGAPHRYPASEIRGYR